MKRILLTLSVLLSALSIYAEHEYIPFVEDGKAWVSNNVTTLYQTSINGKTEINGIEYHKLYLSQIHTPTGEVIEDKLHGYIREEDGKVYVRNTSNKRDVLLYDFGAKVGEEVAWGVESGAKYVIDSIEKQKYYGAERNVYYVSFYYSYSSQPAHHDVWIEGIGSLTYPVMHDLSPNFGVGKTNIFDYCYNYNTDEIFPADKKPYSEFCAPAEESYLPMCVPGREYLYKHTDNDNNKTIVTRLSQKEGYVTFDDGTMGSDLREEGSLILRSYDIIAEENLRALFNENYACVGNNSIYFDYDMHVGDSMYVVDIIACANSLEPRYAIIGRSIKLLSYDYYVSESATHTIYKFESKQIRAELYEENSAPHLQIIDQGEVYSETFVEGIGYSTLATKWRLDCVKEDGEVIYQSGHNYIPVVEPGKAWVTQSSRGPLYYQTAISDKTVEIDGKVYYEVYLNSLSENDVAESEKTLQGYIREEDKKVYSLSINSNEEVLLYDFGALVNDTIHCNVYDVEGCTAFLVMEDIKINEKGRNVYNVSAWTDIVYNIGDINKTDDEIWIEGVGIHNANYICSGDDTRRWGAVGSPADRLVYCYNYITHEIYPANKTPFAEFSAPLEKEYLPTIVSGREYIYASQKYTLDLSTFPSKDSGYTSMDRKDFASYITPLKEDGAIVLRSFPSDYTVAAVEKVQELYTTIERNWVYFDYNLQVGDTLCVVDRIDEYSIIGRIIKVISIDTIEIESQPRLRYNLLSTNFNATLLSNGKHYFHYYGDLNNGEHSLYEYANHCYEDSWIEGIGYTKYNYNGYTLELQRLYEEDVLIYGSEKEDSEYLPTIVPLREYFYKNKQGYEMYMPTRMSERYPGYVDYSDRCCDVRKECNSQVLKEFYEEAFCIYETAKLMKENFTTIGEDWVYFDYNMQVGDTLCVVDDWTATTGHAQYVGGRIVKVLSIDTIETMGIERTRYNLESKEFTCNYGMYAKDPTKDPTIPGNIVYYMDLWYDDTSFSDSWIEGIGYTTFTPVQVSGFDIELDVYELQCVFEEGELIYCADGADCNGKSDVDNSKIDFTTLTLHRQGHVLMAVFPVAGVGESITLYDTTGRVVASQTLRAGATTASIGVASLPSGVYIVRLSNGIAKKVVL